MSENKEMILVEIQITERVTYNKILGMSQSKFDELEKELNSKTCKSAAAKEKIDSLIHLVDDWMDSDDIELDKFEIYRQPEFESDDLPF